MKNAEIITEDAVSTVGSCCDDGRMIFKSCGNHWYNCQESGIADIKTWMRFGKNGFTMSLTEHKGRCQYTPDRQVCALPPDCTRENSDFPQDFKSICREVASVWSSDPAVPSQQFDRSSQISIQNAKKPISLGLNNGPKLTNLMHSAMKKAAQSAR